MNESIKFDPKKLDKLNNPDRLKTLNPDLILKTLNISSPKVLVDIGAGTGFFAKAFASKLKDGKIYACDTSNVMVEWMNKNLSCPNIVPTKSDENTTPLPDKIADLVYLINVYHELEEPSILLSEAYRLLKAGGKLAIIDWKAEETPEGPPINHRVLDSIIIEQVNKSEFSSITNYNVLQQHCFIVAEKY